MVGMAISANMVSICWERPGWVTMYIIKLIAEQIFEPVLADEGITFEVKKISPAQGINQDQGVDHGQT
jgi:hypothetical protein